MPSSKDARTLCQPGTEGPTQRKSPGRGDKAASQCCDTMGTLGDPQEA